MWSDSSVFYQVYPLGAFGCPFENDGVLEHRILNIEKWYPHLERLGIDCVLFNPVFMSRTHGYDTTDYKMIDCRLGTNDDFKQVVDGLHQRNIKVILDAVFNHVGRDFFAFQDVCEKKWDSVYKDWFYIDFNGNSNYNDGFNYQCWEGNDILVKLNLQNQDVVNYIFSIVDFWKAEFHIDGLRLDVAYCLDLNFLKQLHDHVERDFYLLGETLHGDYNRWMNDEMLNSVTNYECYKGIYSSFNCANFYEILYSFNRQFGKDPWCLYTGKHLFNFIDNHDVVRIASILEDKNQLPLVYVMLLTMPGNPCIYYGSEWGIEGTKNWNDTELRPLVEIPEWNVLTDLIASLILIKHEHSALHNGDYTQMGINNTICVYQRENNDECLWICINMKNEAQSLYVNGEGDFIDLMQDELLHIDHSIELDAYAFKILKRMER